MVYPKGYHVNVFFLLGLNTHATKKETQNTNKNKKRNGTKNNTKRTPNRENRKKKAQNRSTANTRCRHTGPGKFLDRKMRSKIHCT